MPSSPCSVSHEMVDPAATRARNDHNEKPAGWNSTLSAGPVATADGAAYPCSNEFPPPPTSISISMPVPLLFLSGLVPVTGTQPHKNDRVGGPRRARPGQP